MAVFGGDEHQIVVLTLRIFGRGPIGESEPANVLVHPLEAGEIAELIGSGCQTYNIEKSQRLVQLCPPDLSFPIEVVIVNEPDMLGSGGERGKGGFGSTGK
mgnify:CR=1 FL=1